MPPPPVILVKTWLQLLQSDMEQEAKIEVENKIISTFGSIEIAIIYMSEGIE
ncbi:hypothetical protein [Paraglaciecola sp.]|uniref:hypothetical protein n=1 Tax=Paraglaciecola sp. TaxID=1920173 RepID=UPI003EF3D780